MWQSRNQPKIHAKARRRKVPRSNLCVFSPLREIRKRAQGAHVSRRKNLSMPGPLDAEFPRGTPWHSERTHSCEFQSGL
jgi:hypothetical protein